MKVAKYFAAATVIACIMLTFFVGKSKISEGKNLGGANAYKGVVTVWQIDTFEGGEGSRRQFLSERAKEFSKKNGTLFLVTDHTKSSAEQNFCQGIFPDVISYGNGVSISGAEPLSVSGFCAGGVMGSKVYAVPWCRGNYFLIKNNKFASDNGDKTKKLSSAIISQGEYTLPLMAAYLEGYEIEGFTALPPFEAYKNFVTQKTPYLIGTQRDIARLNARGENFTATPLIKFCDLYQYVSVTSQNDYKKKIAESFINFLLSNECQNKVSRLFMIPAAKNAQLPTGLSNAKITPEHTISAFTSPERLKRTAEYLTLYYSGEKTPVEKIKNVLL